MLGLSRLVQFVVQYDMKIEPSEKSRFFLKSKRCLLMRLLSICTLHLHTC